jgi:hypothetical protein
VSYKANGQRINNYIGQSKEGGQLPIMDIIPEIIKTNIK